MHLQKCQRWWHLCFGGVFIIDGEITLKCARSIRECVWGEFWSFFNSANSKKNKKECKCLLGWFSILLTAKTPWKGVRSIRNYVLGECSRCLRSKQWNHKFKTLYQWTLEQKVNQIPGKRIYTKRKTLDFQTIETRNKTQKYLSDWNLQITVFDPSITIQRFANAQCRPSVRGLMRDRPLISCVKYCNFRLFKSKCPWKKDQRCEMEKSVSSVIIQGLVRWQQTDNTRTNQLKGNWSQECQTTTYPYFEN